MGKAITYHNKLVYYILCDSAWIASLNIYSL